MQITKKAYEKKKRKRKEESHWEGKFFCDCRIRNKSARLDWKKKQEHN